MGRAVGILSVVLCVSLLEGLWTWLLVAAVSEVAGQGAPLFLFVGLVLFGAWLAARILVLRQVTIERQRWLLIGGGLALALVAGTIQAGVLVPLQIIFGSYTPDLRGAGVVLVVVVAYLWGRGLALSNDVTRDRVINHIAISAGGLVCVLMFLFLTQPVRSFGLGMVVASFAIAITALLLIQAMGVEAHELTPTRWGLIAGAFVAALLLVGGVLTGALSSGILLVIGDVLRSGGRLMTPITDTLLLTLGHLAEWTVDIIMWLGDKFGTDTTAIIQNMRASEQARPDLGKDAEATAPALLSVVTAIFSTLFFGAIAVLIFHRLIGMYRARDDGDIEETRSRARGARGGGLLDLLGRLRGHGDGDADLDARDPRDAVRLHYRRFQLLMARAGLPRAGHETPDEYGSELARVLPSAREEILQIARAYDQARYGEPSAPIPAADGIDQSVQRVRDALATLPERPRRSAHGPDGA